jgi:hypothetical protein
MDTVSFAEPTRSAAQQHTELLRDMTNDLRSAMEGTIRDYKFNAEMKAFGNDHAPFENAFLIFLRVFGKLSCTKFRPY